MCECARESLCVCVRVNVCVCIRACVRACVCVRGTMHPSRLQGAATTCVVATSPALEKVSGKYFSDCQEAKTSVFGEDDEMAKKLWEETEAMLK